MVQAMSRAPHVMHRGHKGIILAKVVTLFMEQSDKSTLRDILQNNR